MAMAPFLVFSEATKPILRMLMSRCSLEKPNSEERFFLTISPSHKVIDRPPGRTLLAKHHRTGAGSEFRCERLVGQDRPHALMESLRAVHPADRVSGDKGLYRQLEVVGIRAINDGLAQRRYLHGVRSTQRD